MSPRRRFVRRATVVLASVTVACDPARVAVPRSSEPMVVMVLTREGVPPSSALSALLATTGEPTTIEYRAATRFEMRRAIDGALFDWRPQAVHSADPLTPSGNYALPFTGSTGLLGRRDLLPGHYTLNIETGGRTITGALEMPDTPLPVIVRRDGSWIAEWPRVSGAARFAVIHNFARFGPSTYTTDTFRIIAPDTISPPPYSDSLRVDVIAFDANYAAYLFDPAAVRAGVEGAHGVFGATATGSVRMPWPAMAPRARPIPHGVRPR